LLWGSIASVCCIGVHAAVMTLVVRSAQAMELRPFRPPSARLPGTMIATVLVFKGAHTLEVMIWALIYLLVGVVPDGSDTIYFAFVNYTTLGYGDIVPVPQWQLLGPMTAMNGVLLFGWSAAVIFEILRRTMGR
jgi:hypothetical protein